MPVVKVVYNKLPRTCILHNSSPFFYLNHSRCDNGTRNLFRWHFNPSVDRVPTSSRVFHLHLETNRMESRWSHLALCCHPIFAPCGRQHMHTGPAQFHLDQSKNCRNSRQFDRYRAPVPDVYGAVATNVSQRLWLPVG